MRLNGWVRLWIVLSFLWISVVTLFVGIGAIKEFRHTNVDMEQAKLLINAFNYNVFDQFDKNPKGRFSEEFVEISLDNKAQGPLDYRITLVLPSSQQHSIPFTIKDIPRTIDLDLLIKRISNKTEVPISAETKLHLSNWLKTASEQVRKVENRYVGQIEAIESAKTKVAQKSLTNFLMFALIPPLLLLCFGYSLAWVRAGFRSS
jgi:hypothetical protein